MVEQGFKEEQLMSASSTPTVLRKFRRYRLTKRFWWFVIAFVVINIGSAYAHQGWKVWQYRKQIAEAQRQLESILKRNEELRAEYAYLQSEAYIEQAARQELGLVMPGETVVIMVQPGHAGDVERRVGASRMPGF